jgi:hypothetical protein
VKQNQDKQNIDQEKQKEDKQNKEQETQNQDKTKHRTGDTE